MIPTNTEIAVRSAKELDRSQLVNMLHFETHVHRHLDWKPPIDWLGDDPYIVALRDKKLVAALACPPDPPGVSWIRMFATSNHLSPTQAWELLWPPTLEYLSKVPDITISAIPLQEWFQKLLNKHGFQKVHNVIVLIWDNKNNLLPDPNPAITIRPMIKEELAQIYDIDRGAFGPIWQNSLGAIEMSYKQSNSAYVAEYDGRVAGYQISTPSSFGAHLARLAVAPQFQGQGVGYSLVRNLQTQFEGRVHKRISVNTQDNNLASLALYEKAGFIHTEESYPVFQYHFK